ncbi:ATP-dependent DNA ligase [Tessaracoccus sp. OS52]|uniref:ATP-dependent DNA ligase n=1 Tax=Tessaracoccus sp. OS52 TaxID=2886691 RepID=UPI001D10433F|nr:ATP-dependent DNA ligase [Tessaracoccus sp. OS52]MCC2593177.1 ATP-dependent DNA ligase [Tessaracoccus sp. OS52]
MLPLELPIEPMLAKAVDDVPVGDYAYEPKWDGYRCIIIRDGDLMELGSRGKKPLTRYFPELLPAVASLPERCIIDAEVIQRTGEPGAERLSWENLSQRIHPAASRVRLLSERTPAELVCFDLLALDDDDWTGRPWTQRRARLEELFDADLHERLHLSAVTRDPAVAADWFNRFEGAGLDGVIAKALEGTYEQGRRTMLKIKHKRTAEAVVVGYRVHKSGEGVGSLLLGMYDDAGELRRVGGIVGLPMKTRRELLEQLQELVIDDADPSLAAPASRFSGDRDQSWVPLAPELVVEVAFDQLEGNRFRHAASFLRWRPDREPSSCRIDQVERALAYDLGEVFDA